MLSDQRAFLERHRVDQTQHSGHSLLDHLLGTRSLLEAWGLDADVCSAGLFHSVYGTESYGRETIPPELRPTIQELIGARAEGLAWLFGILDNRGFMADLKAGSPPRIRHRLTEESISITAQQQADLMAMITANALEQLTRIPGPRQVRALPYFQEIHRHLDGAPAAALAEAIVSIEAIAETIEAPSPTGGD